jgi:hypothetical protein
MYLQVKFVFDRQVLPVLIPRGGVGDAHRRSARCRFG